MRPSQFVVALSLLLSGAAVAQDKAADATVRAIMSSAGFRQAAAALDRGHDQWIADSITLTEIPAPPFKEEARAKAYAEMLRQRGLDVEIDEEGNVLALRAGSAAGPLVIVSAHLDTVFPEGTDVKVRREGEKLHAPGIGDDSAGLSAILSLVDAMNAAQIRTRSGILFVGTVGEEGLGNLRGVRHLFTKGKYQDRASAFFSLDGSGMDRITTAGTGSKRYRVTYKGPGGHSYGAFGIVNPMAALGQTVVDLYKVEVPSSPKTTYSASVVGGGTSVNTIPEEVWLQVDMRSEDPAPLAKLEREFLAIVDRAAAAENRARSTSDGKVSADPKLIGDRPPGRTAASADIVRFAEAAYRAEGIAVKPAASSTDANLPMSLGIPAVTMSRVATAGRAHAPDEWIGIEKADNVKLKRILLATILATAGVP
ncbi:MAG TPA: M20/M25/M40 family metallo-hydrolase [Sphingomicrobium sp.]|nr:M20/M25/M40 family metallo-hydrolase [Sphingomicrobium sp.]